jgi:hypothetical protein
LDSQTHQLRPLQGIPGAAVLGQPLDLGTDILAAASSPRQDYALVLTGDNRDVRLLRFSVAGVTWNQVDGVGAAPDQVRLSPSGSAAALYHQATGAVQIVAGLPDSPALVREVAVAGAGQRLAALAISDDGQVVAVGLEDSATLLIWGAGSTASVPLAGNVRGLAFRPRTQDAAVVTANNQVFLLADITSQPQPTLVAGSDEGISAPVAIAFSSNGQKLFTANSDPGGVTISDLAQGTASVLTCDCSPSGLAGLKGTAVFRLTEARDPLLLFDGTTSPSRILFVPLDQPAATPAASADAQGIGQ